LLKHIPNALTLTRLILAPVIAWLLWMTMNFPGMRGAVATPEMLRGIADYMSTAAVLFIIAAVTDLFDGMAARAFNAHSKLGRIIDPIADKALVGLPLIALSIGVLGNAYPPGPIIAGATAVIVIRDVLMTVIRLTASDGEGARVSSLAKWKTALELLVVGSILVVNAIQTQIQAQDVTTLFEPPLFLFFQDAWLVALVITAALSAYTGWQYLRPAKKS
jgi:CDP-diacylglycerol--glycerol-3-phosphate 3-phosphatidyltransferase